MALTLILFGMLDCFKETEISYERKRFHKLFSFDILEAEQQGNIDNIRYGSIEHKGIRLHLFDSTKFVFPKIASA